MVCELLLIDLLFAVFDLLLFLLDQLLELTNLFSVLQFFLLDPLIIIRIKKFVVFILIKLFEDGRFLCSFDLKFKNDVVRTLSLHEDNFGFKSGRIYS